jgi:hypothetical protein
MDILDMHSDLQVNVLFYSALFVISLAKQQSSRNLTKCSCICWKNVTLWIFVCIVQVIKNATYDLL